jgi:tripeptide aminopeptidase
MSGAGVKPIVHRRYAGGDIVLPDDPSAVLRVADNPALAERIGDDIVTASGTTLLGADDKAGIAAIVAAAELLMSSRDVAHGPVRIAFTPDEEIGRGANRFDVAAFNCVCAYTLDGGSRGELEYESFSADLVTVAFKGFNTHPGYAKGRMVNAIRVAADFVTALPRRHLSPETTDGYDGYVHPYDVNASVDRTVVKVLLRDFVTANLPAQRELVVQLAQAAAANHPGCSIDIEVREQYRNMREVLDQHPLVAEPGARAGRASDPRWHRRVPPVVHGLAHSEHLCRRAQLPLTARVGVSAGHGSRGARHRGNRTPVVRRVATTATLLNSGDSLYIRPEDQKGMGLRSGYRELR